MSMEARWEHRRTAAWLVWCGRGRGERREEEEEEEEEDEEEEEEEEEEGLFVGL
jgi:hypothetical protein